MNFYSWVCLLLLPCSSLAARGTPQDVKFGAQRGSSSYEQQYKRQYYLIQDVIEDDLGKINVEDKFEAGAVYVSAEFSATDTESALRVGMYIVPAEDGEQAQPAIRVLDLGPERQRPTSGRSRKLKFPHDLIIQRTVYNLGAVTISNQQIIDLETGRGLVASVWGKDPVYRSIFNDCYKLQTTLVQALGLHIPDGAKAALRKGATALMEKSAHHRWEHMSLIYNRIDQYGLGLIRQWRFSTKPGELRLADDDWFDRREIATAEDNDDRDGGRPLRDLGPSSGGGKISCGCCGLFKRGSRAVQRRQSQCTSRVYSPDSDECRVCVSEPASVPTS
ncbi:MAG: hypothetical protein M1825_004893 [Sarcosagium campestre]|nr:MAG: hypothetical protein M1825_004893 [Sarcosagium campestre]